MHLHSYSPRYKLLFLINYDSDGHKQNASLYRILNTLLSSRIKFIHFSEIELKLLTVLPHFYCRLDEKMCISLEKPYVWTGHMKFPELEIGQRGKKGFCQKYIFCTQVSSYTVWNKADPSLLFSWFCFLGV